MVSDREELGRLGRFIGNLLFFSTLFSLLAVAVFLFVFWWFGFRF
jgi:hypothetical protein